jgi:very-short-patch-repair endonuclease
MSKDIELNIVNKIKENYQCKIIINITAPYYLFRLSDIGKILGIKNIRHTIKNYPSNEKQLIYDETKGGKQNVLYITLLGLKRVILASRKINVNNFINKIGLDITSIKFTCVESDTLNIIIKTFDGEIMHEQYFADKYYIDLYFPKYKLAIECDENYYDIIADNDRQNNLTVYLNGCTFIRYKPFDKNFNIYNTINDIHKFINNFNQTVQDNQDAQDKSGYIYVFKDYYFNNKSTKDIYNFKIKYTKSIEDEYKIHNQLTFNNNILYNIATKNARLLETVIHHLLGKFQDPEKKEWFHTDFETIKKTIDCAHNFLDNILTNDTFMSNLDILQIFTEKYKVEVIDDETNDIEEQEIESPINIIENIKTEDFSIYKKFINECTIKGDEYIASSVNISGMFKYWNKRSTKEERSLLMKFLHSNFKQIRHGVWNEYKQCNEVTYKGFKLIDIKYIPADENNLSKFDKFIIEKCIVNCSARTSIYKITNEYFKWIKDNKFECLDDRKELLALKKHFASNFMQTNGKFIYEGKKDSAGYWFVDVKDGKNDDQITNHPSQLTRKISYIKKVYKICPNTKNVLHVYNSINECCRLIDKDIHDKITKNISHEGYLYSTRIPDETI